MSHKLLISQTLKARGKKASIHLIERPLFCFLFSVILTLVKC